VLLQPELIDAYASALVNAARAEPDGLGSIAESLARAGAFPMAEDERLRDKGQEALLLIATIEDLLRHEIALREHSDDGPQLFFPSQLTREYAELSDPEGKAVVFSFEGQIQNIYATLAVRLSHSELFRKKEMWRNAATYTAAVGGTCGMMLREIEEGAAEITLFYDAGASDEVRLHFEEFIHAQLVRRAATGTIRRRRIFACRACGTAVSDKIVSRRIEHGYNWLSCPICDQRVSLLDQQERVAASRETKVGEMDRAADARRDREAAVSIIEGKKLTDDFDVFLCHSSADKRAVTAIAERLRECGILPWLDAEQLQPGIPWQAELERQVKRIKTAIVFVGKRGIGPWQDIEMEAFLRHFLERNCPVIPVILPDSPNTPKLPVFLRGMSWIDFRKLDPDPFEMLIWGITGSRSLPTQRQQPTQDVSIAGDVSISGKSAHEVVSLLETAARSDLEEIVRSLGHHTTRNDKKLAGALLRRMSVREFAEIESPLFEPGAVWSAVLLSIGLHNESPRAVLFMRREEENDTRRRYLFELAAEKNAEFLFVLDIIDIPKMAWRKDLRPYAIRFRPDELADLATMRDGDVPVWLGRFITTHVDPSVLVDLLPYRTEGRASLFLGRGDEIERMIGKIGKDPRGGIIMGAHKSGKTSLLYRLGELLRQRGHQVVGPTTMSDETSFDYLFDVTMQALRIRRSGRPSLKAWASALRAHRRKGSPVVFLLDEVDQLIEADTRTGSRLGRQMRSLQYDDIGKFYEAGHAGLREAIRREGGPFRNFAEEFVLKGLTESEGLRLVQEPLRNLGFEVSEDNARRIIRGTAGVAVLIQGFCLQLLKEHLNKGNGDIADSTFDDVEDHPDFLGMVYEYYDYGLTSDRRAVVLSTALAQEVTEGSITAEFRGHGVDLDPRQLHDTLDFLVRFGVLTKSRMGSYRVLSDYLRGAVAKRTPRALLEYELRKAVAPHD
jgi:hypothetical protein